MKLNRKKRLSGAPIFNRLCVLVAFSFCIFNFSLAGSLPIERIAPFFARQSQSSGGGGGSGTYTFIGSESIAINANNSATTSALDTTGAKLIVIACGKYAGTPTITDNKGNSYTARTLHVDSNSSTYENQLYDCILPTAGSGHTWTVQISSGTGYPTIHVFVFSKTGSDPVFDAQTGVNGNGGSATTSAQIGNITPAGDNEVFIAGLSSDHAATAVDSSFTGFITDGNSGVLEAAAYLIQTTGAAVNPTFTQGSTSVFSGSMGAWK